MSDLSELAHLRTLTLRITNASPAQLPIVASQVSGLIWKCRHLLSSASTTKRSNDAATLVHQFKTHISTLLQGRTVESRWSGVVLTKATIEAGGAETLSKSNNWVRCLLAILKRPDPPTTHLLTILTLTRIFNLTWEHSHLIREITTPALAAFVESGHRIANGAQCPDKLLLTILSAYSTLLPRHPTIFRTAESGIRLLLKAVLFGPVNQRQFSTECRAAAAKLWAALPNCASKNGESQQWDSSSMAALAAARMTHNKLFYESEVGAASSKNENTSAQDLDNLPPWQGAVEGCERLATLLNLIRAHISSSTSNAVPLRIGMIHDLLNTIISRGTSQHSIDKLSQSIPKNERDELSSLLPDILQPAVELATTILLRFDHAALPICHQVLSDLLKVTHLAAANESLRTSLNTSLTHLINLIGPTLTKSTIQDLLPTIRQACTDLIPQPPTASTVPSQQTIKTTLQPNSSTSKHQPFTQDPFPNLTSSARILVQTAYTYLPTTLLPPTIRALMDRTAVLTRDRELLVASVLHPAVRGASGSVSASLMPILAGEFGGSMVVEALLRPRMPVVRGLVGVEAEQDEEEEDDDDDEDVDGVEADDDGEGNELVDGNEDVEDEDGEDGDDEKMTGILNQPPAEILIPDVVETANGSGKRKASSVVEDDAISKRTRGAEVVTERVEVEIPLEAAVQQPAVATSVITSHATTTVIEDDDNDDDGSDFEMPPLTMDPDTDSDAEA